MNIRIVSVFQFPGDVLLNFPSKLLKFVES